MTDLHHDHRSCKAWCSEQDEFGFTEYDDINTMWDWCEDGLSCDGGSSGADAGGGNSSPSRFPSSSAVEDLMLHLPAIDDAIQSLVVGELDVMAAKEAAEARLAATLSESDEFVKDIMRALAATLMRVKGNIRAAADVEIKRLDAQCDELAVSVGQLLGLAALIRGQDGSDINNGVGTVFARCKPLLKGFTKPNAPGKPLSRATTIERLRSELTKALSEFKLTSAAAIPEVAVQPVWFPPVRGHHPMWCSFAMFVCVCVRSPMLVLLRVSTWTHWLWVPQRSTLALL